MIKRFFESGRRVATALFFPLYCPNCHSQWDQIRISSDGRTDSIGNGWICPDCWSVLPIAQPFPWYNDPLLEGRVTTIYKYGGVMKEMIHRMKFGGRWDIGVELGLRSADQLVRLLDKKWSVIVPVPLHPIRMRRRGYNQALIIARSIAKRLNLPIRTDLIRRIRDTYPQSKLSQKERLINVQGAFAPYAPNCPIKPIPDGTLLLVDDVIHTGATVRACLIALKSIGFNNVHILAIVR
ncbi:MAG: ComF family protein [Candidatus Electryoneaceae bacterium]|nr:ComF family protein [Candidatus Electryoneaceae bacterium]